MSNSKNLGIVTDGMTEITATADEINEALEGLEETLDNAKAFRQQLREMLGVKKSGSVIAAVRALLERTAVLEGRQSVIADMIQESAR